MSAFYRRAKGYAGILIFFLFLSYCIVEDPSTMLNRSGGSSYACFVSDFKGNASDIYQFRFLTFIPFIQLKKVLFILNLTSIF